MEIAVRPLLSHSNSFGFEMEKDAAGCRAFNRNFIVGGTNMAFFNSAVGVLQTLVIALGAGLGIWGVINLLEGYGSDNPGAKSQGMKQFMAN